MSEAESSYVGKSSVHRRGSRRTQEPPSAAFEISHHTDDLQGAEFCHLLFFVVLFEASPRGAPHELEREGYSEKRCFLWSFLPDFKFGPVGLSRELPVIGWN